MWQEAGVVVVVGGAVYYLARKLFGSPEKKKPTSFVPLSDLKRRRKGYQDSGKR
jgi:hypothetical protein